MSSSRFIMYSRAIETFKDRLLAAILSTAKEYVRDTIIKLETKRMRKVTGIAKPLLESQTLPNSCAWRFRFKSKPSFQSYSSSNDLFYCLKYESMCACGKLHITLEFTEEVKPRNRRGKREKRKRLGSFRFRLLPVRWFLCSTLLAS